MTMNFTRIIFSLALVLSVFVLVECSTYQEGAKLKNVANTYNPSSTSIHPVFKVYHVSDSVSNLFLRINPKELLFNTANPEKEEKARLKIHYKVFDSFEQHNYIDSATVEFTFNAAHIDKDFTSYIPMKMPAGGYYSMEITSTDELKTGKHLSYLLADKREQTSEQNFQLVDKEGKVIMANTLNKQTGFAIENIRSGVQEYYVSWYKPHDDSPLPPFSIAKIREKNWVPDSTWTWKAKAGQLFHLEKEGIYQIKTDSLAAKGLNLFNFGDFYPETRTPTSLLKPLRYLLSSKEYRKLEGFENKKAAIDSFWLSSSGNINRSKELIRVYYSRIHFANTYFTSYTEGWLTDRGMIYTIYGPPKTIYKSDHVERWIYGETRNLSSMDFYFERAKNPFSNNHFILNRQEVFKGSWYQAVDTWRNGRVYSVLN
ncbi:MAG: GWxTD domain-containing protein [Bacteroidales bacterium]|nr:GWxTD domain-containing protein [Bacteroidales bacterium]MCF8457402.1 GWxTD domain-containing protein [Bacteroidales bacterium]